MFEATTLGGATLVWDENVFTGDLELMHLINILIDSKQGVPTISVGPYPHAGSRPGWVAWYTAHHAFQDLDVTWSGKQPDVPRELFDLPEGFVA